MEKETVFSGPLTLEEIKTNLSIKKPMHLIKKRSTICVSEPYRTIYHENPQIDLLLRMQMTDDEDDSNSYIATECSSTSSPNDKNMAPDTIKFIHKLEDILHINDKGECDRNVKFQNNSVILISDDDKSCEYVCCHSETDTKAYEEVEFKADVKIEKTEQELQMSINSSRFTSFEEDSVDNVSEKSNEISNRFNCAVEAKCPLVKQDISFSKQDIDKEQCNKSTDITVAEFVENLSDQSSCSEEKYTYNDSMHFNDTLEEMEIALKYGLDDSMTDVKDNKSEESITINESVTNIINNITSNANAAVAVKINKDFKFKQPINIPPPSPSFHKIPNFKNIVSPVAVYIKNSPRHPLKQNVASTEPSPRQIVFQDQEILKSKVIQPNVLPEVIYKPPRKVLVTKEASMKLPANIQKLLPNTPKVIEHRGRLAKKHDLDLANRLLSEDLSSTNLTFNSTTPLEEISVYNIKDVYIS